MKTKVFFNLLSQRVISVWQRQNVRFYCNIKQKDHTSEG